MYFIRRLRTEIDAENLFLNAHIVEIITKDKAVAEQKEDIIANVFSEMSQRTDAKILLSDVGYTLQKKFSLWKGETLHNNNTNNENAPDDQGYCYQLIPVVGCADVTYIQGPAPCDEPGGFQGFGDPIKNCSGEGGGGGFNPPYTPPSGNTDSGTGGGVPPQDWGQDLPFSPNFINYNGVNLQTNYKNAQDVSSAVDEKLIEAFKFAIDNPTYRNLISAYLFPNTDKITIAFDINTGGGYFDNNTNTIYINPEQLQNIGMLDMVNILVHESIHAMFFKATAAMQTQLDNARSNLVNHYNSLPNDNPLYGITPSTNMIHHEAMGQYYKSEVISILKSFHESSLGVVQNSTNITDSHFEAIFLFSLLQTQYPVGSGNIVLMWITQWNTLSLGVANRLCRKRKSYKKNLFTTLKFLRI